MSKFGSFMFGLALGMVWINVVMWALPDKPVTVTKVKHIYDDEARLVGFCNGKYLIRSEEDEFPMGGCMFIEPIANDYERR